MDNLNETQKGSKTSIYNVVILDQSGSMDYIKREAISGYNETLQTIQAAQEQYADCQIHFVTLVVFNSSSTKTVYDRVNCMDAQELDDKTYRPKSCTPLFDAMGTTLTKFRYSLDAETDYKVLVTIITDGMENDSREYNRQQIHQIVTELKEAGWVFAYIGANHDVESFSRSIAIPNALAFESTGSGTKSMFAKERRHRMSLYNKIKEGFGHDLVSGFFDI